MLTIHTGIIKGLEKPGSKKKNNFNLLNHEFYQFVFHIALHEHFGNDALDCPPAQVNARETALQGVCTSLQLLLGT